jgi:hypothetical protein
MKPSSVGGTRLGSGSSPCAARASTMQISGPASEKSGCSAFPRIRLTRWPSTQWHCFSRSTGTPTRPISAPAISISAFPASPASICTAKQPVLWELAKFGAHLLKSVSASVCAFWHTTNFRLLTMGCLMYCCRSCWHRRTLFPSTAR